MPTFSTIALENLLEPRVRDSYSKPPLPPPLSNHKECEIEVSMPPLAPRHIYISPALYTTPEAAPIPETVSEPLSPSPYVVNHKRRGGGVGVVGSRRSGGDGVRGFEIPLAEGKEKKEGARLIEEVVEDNFGGADEIVEEEVMFGDEKKEKDEEEEDEVLQQFDCRNFVSNGGEFFDAIEDFSSETSISNSPSRHPNLETELSALRLSLLQEIERRKEAEEDLNLMQSQWQSISDLLSEDGLTLPTPSNSSESMQLSNASIKGISQEVVVARFVAHAIGKGQARAEAEIASEAILKSKDQEISRLHDKVRYYEAVNHEMARRNQGIVELARKQRLRRKTRRWFWSCIGVSLAIGISAIAYSYLPLTSKHQEVSSCCDSSDGSSISTSESA